MYPEEEGIFGHAGNGRIRGDIHPESRLPQRRRVEAVQRDHDDVVVTGLLLEIDEGLGPGTSGLVHRNQRPGREVMLLYDGLHQPRHLVGPAAGTRHDHEFNRLSWLPVGGMSRPGE